MLPLRGGVWRCGCANLPDFFTPEASWVKTRIRSFSDEQRRSGVAPPPVSGRPMIESDLIRLISGRALQIEHAATNVIGLRDFGRMKAKRKIIMSNKILP